MTADTLIDPYRNLRQAMLGYLRKKTGDSRLAEDLLHDVFLKAMHAGNREPAPKNMAAWLFAIARNTVIDHYRKKRPHADYREESHPAQEDAISAERELAGCLAQLARRLAPIHQEALTACDFESKTLQAFARERRISLSAAKSRVVRGRQSLKKELLKCCRIELSATGGMMDFQEKPSAQVCESSLCDCG